MLRIDARSSREVQALILGIRRASKEMQGQIRKYTKQEIAPEWQKTLAEHASTKLESSSLVSTARASVSNQNIKLTSASLGKRLSGGLQPRESWAAVEFGADQSKTTTYTRKSPKGTSHSVTRHTRNQLRPRNQKGYVIMPTVREILPRIGAMYIQTAIRTLRDGLDGKAS